MNRRGPRHPLTEDNVIVTAAGDRLCRTCQEERSASKRKLVETL